MSEYRKGIVNKEFNGSEGKPQSATNVNQATARELPVHNTGDNKTSEYESAKTNFGTLGNRSKLPG